MNVKTYVEYLQGLPLPALMIAAAHLEAYADEGPHTTVLKDNYMNVINEITRIYPCSLQQQTRNNEYLSELVQRATPEALKAAKKTLLPFLEQQVYRDMQQGTITREVADAAKQDLPIFLTQNKTDDKTQ
jgi:hypothetical protein